MKAIIIGSSSGLGLEVSKRMKAEGWQLLLAARRTEPMERLHSEAPEQIRVEHLDITSSDAETKLEALLKEFAPGLFLLSSGYGSQNKKLDRDIEELTILTNALGFSRMVGCAFRYFAERYEREGRCGHLAAITSIAGTKGLGVAPSYSATKAFGTTYLQSLNQLVGMQGLKIYITDIRPGFVRTPLLGENPSYPMLMEAGKVAEDIVKAIKKKKAVVVIDWRWWLITWVWRVIPNWVWRRMRVGR